MDQSELTKTTNQKSNFTLVFKYIYLELKLFPTIFESTPKTWSTYATTLANDLHIYEPSKLPNHDMKKMWATYKYNNQLINWWVQMGSHVNMVSLFYHHALVELATTMKHHVMKFGEIWKWKLMSLAHTS
jgi:hypothetical protein